MRISAAETNLLFGLSLSRAASAIAIILIGFNMGIVEAFILNNTVILILITSIVSSYITQKSGEKVLLKENNTLERRNHRKQKLLVPVANPANMGNLLEFSILIKKEDDHVPVFPLTVFIHNEKNNERIPEYQEQINKVIKSLNTDVPFSLESRIDNSVTGGIVKAANEIVASAIIIGWNNRNTPIHILFGGILDNLLNKTHRMLVVLKTPSTFNNIRKILLNCPGNVEYERGFTEWIDTLLLLAKKLQSRITIQKSPRTTVEALKLYGSQINSSKYFDFQPFDSDQAKDNISFRVVPEDLLVFVHARKNTISYSRQYENYVNNSISGLDKNNVIIIYPAQ